jgi:hypothetical protein
MANITLNQARALGIVVQSAVAMVDARLRVAVTIVITRTFACVNLVVLAMVLLFFIVDHASQNSPVVTSRTVRVLESVRRLHEGLQSFLSMSRIEAR